MAHVSPGVVIRELDLSDYVQVVSGTIMGMLGGATKGPVNEPTDIRSVEQLIQTFGFPQLGLYGFGLHAASEYLNAGLSPLVFLRVSDGTHATADVDVEDISPTALFTVSAITPGTWGNNIRFIVTDVEADPDFPGSWVFNVEIQVPADNESPPQNFTTVESWNYLQPELKLSSNPSSPRFVESVINNGIQGEVAASRYVEISFVTDGAPVAATYNVGDGTAGDDGVAALGDADYIGIFTGQTATGLKAFSNPESVEINALSVPGVSSAPVVEELLAICEARQDAIAIIDPPFGLDVDTAIDWHNGAAPYTHDAFNSSYGALYWPWIQVFDAYTRQNIFMPPSGFIGAIYAQTDRDRAPWFAPAGLQRGGVDRALRLEMSPNPSQRDQLYTGGNVVNPIVNFVGQGIHVFGQKTLQRRATALQSVNVRRMLLVAKKAIARVARQLVFEPNDPTFWAQFRSIVNPILANIAAERGIQQFKVIMDASTNPPSEIDQGHAKARLLIQPTRAAEVINIDMVILSSGAQFS